MLAMTLARGGELPGAIEVLERTSSLRSGATFSGTGLFWIKCQIQLAKMYDEIGREYDARSIREELQSLLSMADPDCPLLDEIHGASKQPAQTQVPRHHSMGSPGR